MASCKTVAISPMTVTLKIPDHPGLQYRLGIDGLLGICQEDGVIAHTMFNSQLTLRLRIEEVAPVIPTLTRHTRKTPAAYTPRGLENEHLDQPRDRISDRDKKASLEA